MSYYDNDYHDDMYDRYRLTGEGAEYFEDDYEEEDYYGYENEAYEEYKVKDNTQFDGINFGKLNRNVNNSNHSKQKNRYTPPSKIEIIASIIIYTIVIITILTCLL